MKCELGAGCCEGTAINRVVESYRNPRKRGIYKTVERNMCEKCTDIVNRVTMQERMTRDGPIRRVKVIPLEDVDETDS